MNEKELKENLLKRINAEKDSILTLLNSGRGYAERDAIESFSSVVLKYLDLTFAKKVPNILRIVSIKEPIVSPDIAKYCLYSEGFYY